MLVVATSASVVTSVPAMSGLVVFGAWDVRGNAPWARVATAGVASVVVIIPARGVGVASVGGTARVDDAAASTSAILLHTSTLVIDNAWYTHYLRCAYQANKQTIQPSNNPLKVAYISSNATKSGSKDYK